MRVADLYFRRFELVVIQFLRCQRGLPRVNTNGLRIIADINAALLLAGLEHQQQDSLLPFQRGFAVGVRVVNGGQLRQTGQKCGLRQSKVAG